MSNFATTTQDVSEATMGSPRIMVSSNPSPSTKIDLADFPTLGVSETRMISLSGNTRPLGGGGIEEFPSLTSAGGKGN
jgi:hypothetical protein